MKVLLLKPKFENIFTRLSLIKTEPLELEYMAAICDNLGAEYQICDMTLKKQNFMKSVESFQPDIIAITANFVHIEAIKQYLKQIENISPKIKIIVGGPHPEVRPEEFFIHGVDVIVYSGGFKAFENILKNKNSEDIKGIYYFQNSKWIKNDREFFECEKLPFPDRSHFYKNIKEYNYITMKPCAILKASYSCPHKCNYCFSTLLNGGRYACREPENVVEEIKNINCDNIWIVDDTFYVDRKKLENFIDLIKENNIQKIFSLYYRADFIANNPDIMLELSKIGVKMCAVGLEVIDNETLKKYEKKSSVNLILKALEVLKACNITCIGLFMIDIDCDKDYFKKLYKFIEKHDLSLSTVSILTPMSGTFQYEKYKDRIITNDYRKWDFIHLIINPSKMSRFEFYKEYYKLHVKLVLLNLKARNLSLPEILKSVISETLRGWFEAFKSLGGR